jgi:peptide/nickel transport system ATP-binding protein
VTGERAVVEAEGLEVSLTSGSPIVQDVALRVGPGEILGVVGESGSGKSTLGLALLGYARRGARITGGSVRVVGSEVVGARRRELERIRRRVVSYVPQDPALCLNPSRRIQRQILDRITKLDGSPEQRANRALARVQLPVAGAFVNRFPHQLSGGQQQRAMIAMAVATTPELVVLDEPTTGLDVLTQSRLLDELNELRNELGLAMVYITHDIAAVATIADSIAVMYAGRIVEHGPASKLLARPLHPYTRGLIGSVPDPAAAVELDALPGVAVAVGAWPQGCAFAPRCTQATSECERDVPEEAQSGRRVRCLHWRETPPLASHRPRLQASSRASRSAALLSVEGLRASHRGRDGEVVAADGISFSLAPRECLALVGESGSGKTTIARCVAGLHVPDAGVIALDGQPLAARARARDRAALGRIQIVFQNPADSLNPRRSIGASIARPAQRLTGSSAADARQRMREALERVRLPVRVAERYPHELSGGERQRAAIARALVVEPSVLVCDEITSALDVSVQSAVLDVLKDLQDGFGLSLLFITHDLGVVASVADRVMVLSQGSVCEDGDVAQVLASPREQYTRQLVAAAPRLDRRAAEVGA